MEFEKELKNILTRHATYTEQVRKLEAIREVQMTELKTKFGIDKIEDIQPTIEKLSEELETAKKKLEDQISKVKSQLDTVEKELENVRR